VSEPSNDVIGVHVSQLPAAIADVWPIVDQGGVVVQLVRTWDDADYVRLGEDGTPVDDIASTHHLMPRTIFKTTVLPEEWDYVAARRVSRGLKQLGNPFAVAEAFGDGRELEALIELNAGAGRVIDTIDTCPPFTHVIELNGEFFVVEKRGETEPPAEAEGLQEASATEREPDLVARPEACETEPGPGPVASEDSAAPQPEPAAPVAAGPPPEAVTAEAPVPTAPDSVAEQVYAAAAVEAAMVPEGAEVAVPDVVIEGAELSTTTSATPRPESATRRQAVAPASAADLLRAIHAPDADEPEDDDRPQLDANVARRSSGLASEIDEGIWEDEPVGAPAELAAGPAPRRAATLMSEMPEDEDLESMRESAYAQATAFVTAASTQSVIATDHVLTLEQVRGADCFAWDEFMNLYLPHVGFVAAVLTATPAAGNPAEVAFSPRSEADVRPVGWHHLAGCECRFCQ